MKNFTLGSIAIVVLSATLLFSAGCSQGIVAKSGPDLLMEDMISCMNGIADAVEAGESESTVEKAQEKYEKARKKFADLPAKDQTMPCTRYMVQMQSAQKRMAKAVIAHTLNKVKNMQGRN